MKFEGICFPHPVLGRYDDVTGKYSVTDPIYEGGESASKITVEHELFSPVIAEQLKKGNVAFATELHCKNTGYRETFICDEPNSTKATQHIEIPKVGFAGLSSQRRLLWQQEVSVTLTTIHGMMTTREKHFQLERECHLASGLREKSISQSKMMGKRVRNPLSGFRWMNR